MKKICAFCGELVDYSLLQCPKCKKGVFETEKKSSIYSSESKEEISEACFSPLKKPKGFFKRIFGCKPNSTKSEIVYGDLPIPELILKAEQILQMVGGSQNAKIYFIFTCEKCGERIRLVEPNKIYEKGVCDNCGHINIISKGAFMAIIDKSKINKTI